MNVIKLYACFTEPKTCPCTILSVNSETKFNVLKKTAKADYISEQIELNKNNSKGLWKTLKGLGYNNKSKSKDSIVLNINNQICYDPVTVAEHINDFFVGIAQKLVDNLPPLTDLYSAFSNSCKQFYNKLGTQPGMFKLKSVSSAFVLKELQALKVSKSTGLDDISPRFLHDGAEGLCDVIAHLINLSINNCVVPDCTKKAVVTPLFKKNNKLDVGNYRPVSVLTSLSKILEKAVHKQVELFCKENNILYPLQSGFRCDFSTDTCLTHLHDHIRNEISHGMFVGMALLDVQKAFDSVNHRMLCEKIRLVGIDPEWFKSYLVNRKQIVSVNNNYSTEKTINAGVPQGSILGPWCYLIYANDLPSCTSCKVIIYADDTILLVSNRDLSIVSQVLSAEISNCFHWLTNNLLSMHMGKTETIVFSSKRKQHLTKGFSISCNGQTIKASTEVKYLGLKLDKSLSGTSIVNSIVSKCTARLKFLYRHSSVLNQKCRKLLVSALVQSHFDYGTSAWYWATTKQCKRKLQVAQNKLVRFILNMQPRTHIGQTELNRVNFLNTNDRVKQLMLNHMYNVYHKSAPRYLSQGFTAVQSQHSYSTRSADFNFVVPIAKGVSQFNFSTQGVKVWNSLPSSTKCLNVKTNFKSKVKMFLRQSALDSEQSTCVPY